MLISSLRARSIFIRINIVRARSGGCPRPRACVYPQSINPNNGGKIPVAIITTDTFDALTVNPPTVHFAGAAPLRWSSEGYDGDGDIDLILKFKKQECVLPTTPGYHQVLLDGFTMGGIYVWDYDWVHIV